MGHPWPYFNRGTDVQHEMHPRLTHIIICKRNNSCTYMIMDPSARESGPAGRTDTQRVVCKFTREVDCKNLHYILSLECVDMFSSHPISCFSGTTKPNTTIPKPPTRLLLLLGYYSPEQCTLTATTVATVPSQPAALAVLPAGRVPATRTTTTTTAAAKNTTRVCSPRDRNY